MSAHRLTTLLVPVVAVVVSTASAAYQSAGTVSGRVTDDQGRPMAGVVVTARYQSNPGGMSYTLAAPTGRDGRYSIRVGDRPGAWSVHAQAEVGGMTVNLTPSDGENFASNAATTRDFTLRFQEQTADDPYGDGAMLVVQAAIMDYTPLDEVEVTLRPVDGGPAIVRRLRQTGEGHVVTGLRPRIYEVSARHNGRPLQVSPALTPHRDHDWGASHTAGFERTGPGIHQLRVEVRSN